jgi:L-threonylcarbamoyladenylate synthase
MIIAKPKLQDLKEAALLLKSGSLVAFPTETVYGLGADAQNPSGVGQVFDLKGRPKDHPLIVHLASAQMAHHFAVDIPEFATALMTHFWPGPLTLILKRKEGVAIDASGHQPTIGLRVPNHPLALDLLREALSLGVKGIAAPSANRFGRVSPTQAQHVLDEFGESLCILDGGACDIGIESTIVDCTRGSPILLRPGQLLAKDIERFAPEQVLFANPTSTHQKAAPKASGTLLSHYAPKARVRLVSSLDLQAAQSRPLPPNLALWTHHPLVSSEPDPSKPNAPIWRAMPQSAQACAHELFATLRAFDALGVSEIWIQSPPHEPEWLGVLDRLSRAAHP